MTSWRDKVATAKVPRRGFITTRKAITAPTANAGASFTFLSIVAAEQPFDYVRVGYTNRGASPLTIDKMCMAAAPTFASNGTSGMTWVAGTFNAATAAAPGNGLPPAPSGSNAGVTVPALSNGVPGFAWSDWMQVSSLARTESASDPDPVLASRCPLVHIRSYCAAGGALEQSVDGTGALGQVFYAQNGRVFATGVVSGDKVANPSSSGLGEQWNNPWVLGDVVQFAHRTQALNVAMVGDSITRGQGYYDSTKGYLSWGHFACAALSSADLPISFANYGFSGQTHAVSMRIARQLLDNLDLDAIVLFPWSPNDGAASESVFTAAWIETMATAQYAISKRVIPILATSIPCSGIGNGATDAFRIASNMKARASGLLVMDFDAAMTDSASPARIRSTFDRDGTHPNNVGYQTAMAPVALRTLAQLTAMATL